MDIELLFNNVEVITGQALVEWYRDYIERWELLADAVATGKLSYIYDEAMDDPTKVEVSISTATDGVCSGLDLSKELLRRRCLSFKADEFRDWYYSVWSKAVPVSPTLPFMSDRLKLAVEISAKVYPDGYTDKGRNLSYLPDKTKIDAELEKHGIESGKDLFEWMQKIINPGKH